MSDLKTAILATLKANFGTVTLPELRGLVTTTKALLDATLLSMADDGLVVLAQDADPIRFSPAEREEMLEDGPVLFTTVSLR